MISPYESDRRKWLKQSWIDQYTGNRYRITTDGYYGGENYALVKTCGKVVDAYESHPESKCAGDAGLPCVEKTVGLLQRRHVYIGRIRRIGEESNKLEEVQSGGVSSAGEGYPEYPDPADDEWSQEILPILRKMPLSFLIKESGLSKRALLDIRAGRSVPHPRNRELLMTIARKWVKIQNHPRKTRHG